MTLTHAVRLGLQTAALIAVLVAVVIAVTEVVEADLRVAAPLLSFVILTCAVQIVIGRISRPVCACLGSFVFAGSALIDPVFGGQMRLQPLGISDAASLVGLGGVAGLLGGILLGQLFLAAIWLRRDQPEQTYAVPRRFGISSLLFAMTFFALLFFVLKYTRARPGELFFYASFVATVGIFQAVMRKAPRWASILAGGIFLPVTIMLFGTGRRGIFPVRIRIDPTASYEMFLLSVAVAGLVVGYLGGTLIAGVFLISDYLTRALAPIFTRSPQMAEIAPEPHVTGSLTELAERVALRRQQG